MSSKVLSIMFTDIKGFTERTSSTSREALVGLLKKHDSLLIPVINKFNGTVIKTIGDAFLVTFDSPTNAVLCGVMIQQNLRDYNGGREEAEKIFIRVSINMGEVEIRDGDVFGEAVNIAARLEGVTEASEIYFTESVYLAMNKAEVPSSEVGSFRLKGIPEAIKVYRVIQDTNSDSFQKIIERLRGESFTDISIPSAGSVSGMSAGRKSRAGLIIAAALIACAAIYLTFFMRTAGRDYNRCLEILRAGDTVHAMLIAEDMLKNYPADIRPLTLIKEISLHEIEAQKKKNDFEKAYKIIEERKAQYKWIDFEIEEKFLLLEEADYYLKKENRRAVENIYYTLQQKFPGDFDVLMSIINNCGAESKEGANSRAVYAAVELCEKNPQLALCGAVVKTLIAGLKSNDFKSETAVKIRSILKTRHPEAEIEIKKLLAAENIEEKANAFMFMKESGKMNEIDEYNYNFNILMNYGSSNSRHVCEAVNYFESLIKAGGVEKLKKNAAEAGNVFKNYKPVILSENDYLSGSVAVILQKAFWNEIKDAVPAWAGENKDYWLRSNAYDILKKADKLDSINIWKFHEQSLEIFDPAFIPDIFTDAAEYFGGFAKKEKAAEARAVLLKCAEYVKKCKAEYEAKDYKEYIRRAQANLEKLETELARF